MTDSRARGAVRSVLLAAAWAGVATASLAQTGPLRLEPPGAAPSQPGPQALPQVLPQAAPPGAPQAGSAAPFARPDAAGSGRGWPFGPAPGGSSVASPAGTPSGTTEIRPQVLGGGAGVTVTRLGALDVDFAGTLGDQAGGLGIDMWRGSSRQTVLRLVPAVPATAISPSGRDLLRRLLLSSAEAPEPVSAASPRGAILIARLERLAAMGERRGLDDLLQASASLKSEPLARLRADQALLRGDPQAACNQEREAGSNQNDRYWAQLNVFCRSVAGEHERAALAAQLLRETGSGPADETFDTLVRALRGDVAQPLGSLRDPTPLSLAMLRAARQPIPGDVMAKPQNGGMLLALVSSPNATLETRLAAAERAVALGAMAGESLSQIYVSVPHTPADIASALPRAQELGGAKGRALLHRAVDTQTDLIERVKLLRAALAQGSDRVGYLASIRANLAAIEAIPATPTFLDAATDFARALLYVRRFDAARRWLSLVARAPADETADGARLALWPYAVLDSGRGGTGETVASPAEIDAWLSAWRTREAARDPARVESRTALVYGLLQAFGYPISESAWAGLLKAPYSTPGSVPALALSKALQAAAAAGRTGETLLIGLVMLGEGGIAEAGPSAALQVIEALRGVGLDGEARQLAIEALVVSGL